LFPLFATGVIDTSGKFTTGFIDTSGEFTANVVDTGGNLPPVSLTPVANLQQYRRQQRYRWQMWHWRTVFDNDGKFAACVINNGDKFGIRVVVLVVHLDLRISP
jgi:hypothetical protein